MGKAFLDVIRQVGIFIILAQMLLHFKPAESYGKYIRLLMSLMVLVQLLVPVLGIVFHGMPGKFDERRHFYKDSFAQQLEEINITCVMAEELLNNMTMEEIKTRINNSHPEESEGEASRTAAIESNLQESSPIQIDRIEVKTDD